MRVLAIVHQADAGPGVFAEAVAAAGHRLELWHPADGEPLPAEPSRYGAVLTFGGGMHPDQDDSHAWLADERTFLAETVEQTVPVLAVCLGSELLAQATGHSARRAVQPEIGWYPIRVVDEARSDPLIGTLPTHFMALEWHSYAPLLLDSAVALAESEACVQAYRVGACAWGIQFHAEVTLPTLEAWLDEYREDADAVAMGIDPDLIRSQTRQLIDEWNRLGHELCTRFLEIAVARAGVPAGADG
jgi:GMP synthase (glutamine-hydrolysing)